MAYRNLVWQNFREALLQMVGFSLFVIQGIPYEPISFIIRSTLPFLIIMILMVVLLATFPDLVLYLPNRMIK
ncbi:MAG: hypothetical protein OQK50_08500 [Deltaproteobacteria bacterium]|nr:hypothetical protein [Deltaproteobacteria bacterium]MCW9050353.1 hypothetical protein [Deltaproteobacteria bacterium]